VKAHLLFFLDEFHIPSNRQWIKEKEEEDDDSLVI
jgi:hypothetical protein